MTKPIELSFTEDLFYTPTPEEERQHWVGKGHIEFFVEQNVPGIFEIEIIDYSGCAGGLDETIGLDYAVKEFLVDVRELHEGVRYTIKGLTVSFTRGDGWTTDDDSDYEFEELEVHWSLLPWMKQKMFNIWWRQIGWKLHERKNKT